MKYAYIRVSTDSQEYDRQLATISAKHPDVDEWVTETYTGTKRNRPLWMELDAKLKAGDVLVVDSLSRLSRSIVDSIEILKSIADRDVIFISIKEQVDYSTPMGKAMVHIIATFSQLERDMTAERTKEALAVRKANGVILGRPVNQDKYDFVKNFLLSDQFGGNVLQASMVMGVSRTMVNRYIKRMATEGFVYVSPGRGNGKGKFEYRRV